MKKSLSSLVLAGALLLGAVAPVTANAATIDKATTSGETKTSVSFTKPEDQTTPVDPTDPSTPVDPTKPGAGDHGGATVNGDLTFLYVSKGIDFGSHDSATSTKAAADMVVPVKSIETQAFNGTTADPDLVSEVADTRGTNAGWRVSVNATKLTTKDGDTIEGAKIALKGSNAVINNSAEKVSSTDADIDGSDVNVPTDESSQVLYTAQANHGAGSTAMSLSAANISLISLPANIKTGDYTGTLNWTLNDTPAD